MLLDITNVANIVAITGTVVIDGEDYGSLADCRTLIGRHNVEVDEGFTFALMKQSDHDYVRELEKAPLILEIIELEYQVLTGEEL